MLKDVTIREMFREHPEVEETFGVENLGQMDAWCGLLAKKQSHM